MECYSAIKKNAFESAFTKWINLEPIIPSIVSQKEKNKYHIFTHIWACLVAQRLKRLPPMRETWVRSLGWEDPLEKEMVTHSSILAWRIPWMEKPGKLQSTGSQRVGHD